MTDITAALWTVRDALAKAGDREGIAAIGRISEELTRLRDEREDIARNLMLMGDKDGARAVWTEE